MSPSPLFPRRIEQWLHDWSNRQDRKPLVIRGARQTGKTTTVRRFSQRYEQFVDVNLDRYEERKIFDEERPFPEMLDELFFLKRKHKDAHTLIFLDEIQQSPQAMKLLRYFYEDVPQYHVIAAGSLLEQTVDVRAAFPVGRASFLYQHPVSFAEFLEAVGDPAAVEACDTVPHPPYAHRSLLELFHTYTVIGGMPEAVRLFVEQRDILQVGDVYDGLIRAYEDDVSKYSHPEDRGEIIGHVFHTMLHRPLERITFTGYGSSDYGSRKVKEAFRILEKAMLCSLVYPVGSYTLPVEPNLRRKPRLHIVDTGLCSHTLGIQQQLLRIDDLVNPRKGLIAEHVVGQELTAANPARLHGYTFWTREKKQSSAEIDYLITVDDRLIPVEVKSGATGRLRSLMRFVDESGVPCGVRLSAAPFSVEKTKTIEGNPFTLINIPYYHAARIADYVRSTPRAL